MEVKGRGLSRFRDGFECKGPARTELALHYKIDKPAVGIKSLVIDISLSTHSCNHKFGLLVALG